MEAHLIQGTPEWKSWRNSMIGASDAACVLGIGFLTPLQLYNQKMGLSEDQPFSEAMKLGLDIEPIARDCFYAKTGIKVEPRVIVHNEYKWMHASLDGCSDDIKTILEIKRVKKEYHEMARCGNIPDIYYAQLHHQMFVCELNECFYLSYRENDEVLVKVARDQDYIDDMIPKLLDFKRRLTDFDPPPMTDRDYEDMSGDEELRYLISQYNEDQKFIKALQDRADRFKDDIKRRVGEKNAKGQGWRFTKYKVQGRVDYDAALSHYNVNADLEQFRKPGSVSYRLTVE